MCSSDLEESLDGALPQTLPPDRDVVCHGVILANPQALRSDLRRIRPIGQVGL
mgnify:CR=1 FL=1